MMDFGMEVKDMLRIMGLNVFVTVSVYFLAAYIAITYFYWFVSDGRDVLIKDDTVFG